MKLGFATFAATAFLAMASAVPASASVLYSLDAYLGSGTAPTGPYGTVSLTQNGGNVDVNVQLGANTYFANTGAGDILLFNLDLSPISVTNMTSNGQLASNTSGSIHAGASGYWDYAVECVLNVGCGNGGSAPHTNALSFTILNAAISDFQASTKGYYFASDLCLGYSATGGCQVTGVVGTKTPTPPTHVPEPATLALFGAGLLGLGGTLRRKQRVKKAAA